jgi:hypothetical protein
MKNYKQSPPPSPPPSHLFIHNTIQQSGKYSRRRSNEGNGALYAIGMHKFYSCNLNYVN